eukprot:GHUV01027781.1.p1 GENE.GHUV01027781.1~~GHUV01027781.1.p1  ORF type:complete len:180 (-),score=17.41 GHUV01027781.1:819-1358(-)
MQASAMAVDVALAQYTTSIKQPPQFHRLRPALICKAAFELLLRHFLSCQGPGGKQLSNGSWTGVMGELTTHHADMALFPLTLTSQRSHYIEHTQSFMDDGYGMLVKTRQIDSGYSFLLPFQPLTWALFLLALVAVMVIISVLDGITRRARLRAIERTHGVVRVQRVRKRGKTAMLPSFL